MDNSSFNPNADAIRIKQIKLIVVSCLILIVAIIIFQILYSYLFKGSIVVTTNAGSNSSIVLTPFAYDSDADDSGAKSVAPTQLINGKSHTLKAGQYTAIVKADGSSASQILTVAARKTAHYYIKLILGNNPPALVANVNSVDFTVNDSDLYYLDQSTTNLFQINSQNQISNLNSDIYMDAIGWINGTFGLGQASNGVGTLYIVNNGQITQLSTPEAASNLTKPKASIAPNQTIYLAIGKKIYSGGPAGDFNLVYTATTKPSGIVALNDSFLLTFNIGGTDASRVESIKDGKVIANKVFDAYSIDGSPNDQYVTTTADSGSQIRNAQTLNIVYNVPYNNINNIVWLSNTTILFSVSNQLWQYNLQSGEAQMITAAPANRDILYMTLDPSKSYVYMSIEQSDGSNNDTVIDRFGLNDQPTPTSIYKVQNNLPWLSGRCLMSLVNFGSPPTIFSYGGQPQDNCPLVSQDYIKQLGVNPSDFSYQATNIPPNEPSNTNGESY